MKGEKTVLLMTLPKKNIHNTSNYPLHTFKGVFLRYLNIEI